MKAQEAVELGKQISTLVQANQPGKAYAFLAPILAERTPFRMLDRIGAAIGVGSLEAVNPFLEHVAATKTEGGWVVIAKALGAQLDRDGAGAFARCRGFIITADIWYATDILGERVPGPALVMDFESALALLAPWWEDANRWIRRTMGVAIHFWAKRSRGAAEYLPQVEKLLAFVEPMFEEKNVDAIKGVGWGLKTMGRNYPDLLTSWLRQQLVHQQRHPRALMLRKALTYLSDTERAQVTK